MSTIKPKVKIDNAQEVQKQTNVEEGGALLETLCVIGQLLLFLIRLIYYCAESIYYKINPNPPTSVKGEIILITGTGHGIGKELALVYASKGATVVGWDINKKNNDETIKEILELGYPKPYSFECDITDRAAVLRVAKEVQEKVGSVSILVNNAGIMPCHTLAEHTQNEIEKIISINLLAHFWLLEAFLPCMKQRNHGHIVSLSSMAGLLGFQNLVPYCASKFAVRGYMEALHEELRLTIPNNKIKFTIIYPYMVDTGLCKRPKIKYERLMPMLSPKLVAREIFHAQTKGKLEVTIPEYVGALVFCGRLLPYRASLDLKDTFESFVDSDLN